ncbi:MAG: hypothetical protein EHM23_14575 [Acidobacteria bacterium]|nr:MAG: hypothetical protein EHM23_14575 [Acidobacteriota bacterium]
MLILGTLILRLLLGGTAELQTAPTQAAQIDHEIDSAQKWMQAREFGKALEVLSALMQREQAPPPDVYILMATCHLNLKETDRALEVFERGMALYPHHPVLEEFYVKLLTNYVPVEQMKAKLEKAVEASPRSLVLLRAAAFVELRVEAKSDRAGQIVDRLVEVAPDNPDVHYIRGLLASLNEQEDQAISAWEKALTLAGSDARMQMDINTLIGEAENRRNRAGRAEAAFRKALKANLSLEKHNSASAYFYADFLAKQSRFVESQKLIHQILSWAPSYGPALLQNALHLARSKKPEDAVVAAELALAGNDLDPQQTRAAHVLLVKTYFQLKRMADAERHQQWLKAQ